MNPIRSGALLAYHGKSALVRDTDGEKIQIQTAGGGSKSVRPKDVEFIHPGPSQQLPQDQDQLPGNIDEILELIGEESFPFPDFCELVYSEYTVQSAWNAYQLLKSGLYFASAFRAVYH